MASPITYLKAKYQRLKNFLMGKSSFNASESANTHSNKILSSDIKLEQVADQLRELVDKLPKSTNTKAVVYQDSKSGYKLVRDDANNYELTYNIANSKTKTGLSFRQDESGKITSISALKYNENTHNGKPVELTDKSPQLLFAGIFSKEANKVFLPIQQTAGEDLKKIANGLKDLTNEFKQNPLATQAIEHISEYSVYRLEKDKSGKCELTYHHKGDMLSSVGSIPKQGLSFQLDESGDITDINKVEYDKNGVKKDIPKGIPHGDLSFVETLINISNKNLTQIFEKQLDTKVKISQNPEIQMVEALAVKSVDLKESQKIKGKIDEQSIYNNMQQELSEEDFLQDTSKYISEDSVLLDQNTVDGELSITDNIDDKYQELSEEDFLKDTSKYISEDSVLLDQNIVDRELSIIDNIDDKYQELSEEDFLKDTSKYISEDSVLLDQNIVDEESNITDTIDDKQQELSEEDFLKDATDTKHQVEDSVLLDNAYYNLALDNNSNIKSTIVVIDETVKSTKITSSLQQAAASIFDKTIVLGTKEKPVSGRNPDIFLKPIDNFNLKNKLDASKESNLQKIDLDVNKDNLGSLEPPHTPRNSKLAGHNHGKD
jgi:hypothetical protein